MKSLLSRSHALRVYRTEGIKCDIVLNLSKLKSKWRLMYTRIKARLSHMVNYEFDNEECSLMSNV